MKAFLVIAAFIVLAILNVVRATQDISVNWETIAFDAGGDRVEVKATFPSYQVTTLKVWISGKLANIPHSEFEQISNPKLEKIVLVVITRGQGSKAPPEEDLEIPFNVYGDAQRTWLKPGGTWVFRFVAGKYVGKSLRPPEPA